MRVALIFSLLVVLAVDFTTLDVAVPAMGARFIEWDDEEESVPARRQRDGSDERPERVTPPGPRTVDQHEARRRPELRAAGHQPDRAVAWPGPVRHVDFASRSAAPPSEDH